MNPRARPVTFPTLHSSLLSACGYCGMVSSSQTVSAFGVTVTFLGVTLQMQSEYLWRFPKILYAELNRDGGDDGKGTLPNFFLSIIWKSSSQFVIIPFLPRCLPPAEHVTPGRLSGIQGPSRKKSPEF